MSDPISKNEQLVHELYEAFARGDAAFILGALDEQVVWTCYGPASLPFTGTFIGPANVARFFDVLGTTQTNQNLKIDETHVAGDHVITIGSYSGKITATNKTFDSKVAHVFTMRDGKVVRFLDFIDTAHAIDAYSPASATAAG